MAKKINVESLDIYESIKYNVLNRKVSKVTDLISLECAIVYPFRYDYYEKFGDPKIVQCILPLKLIVSRCDADLSDYSFEGMVDYFRNEFVSKVSTPDKHRFIDVFSDNCRYDIVSDNFEITYKNEVASTILKTYQSKECVYNGYGSRSYPVHIKELLIVYNKLVESRGGRGDYDYVWQWKISLDEYSNIKSVITKCESKKLKDAYQSNVNCLKLLVIYIAEYYKREWNANDGRENIVNSLNLNSAEIAKAYFGENSSKIYKYPKRNGGVVHEWLDALYVEGGLPIKYIIQNQSQSVVNRPWVKFASKLYDNPDEAIELFKSLRQTIQHSYDKGYSIKSYVDTLLNQKFVGVCSVDDIEQVQEFREFNALLERERSVTQSNSKKFAYKYRVWRFYSEFVLYRSIVLQTASCYNEPQELISRDRIERQWGVNLGENDIFYLEIGGRRYKFHPWTDKYYRSVNGLLEFPLATVVAPHCEKAKDKVYFIGPDNIRREIPFNEKNRKDDYLKFTSRDGYEWVTGASRYLSAVLLPKSVKVELTHSETDVIVGENLRWIEYTERIKIGNKFLNDGTSEINLDGAKHFVSTCKYIRSVLCNINGEHLPVPCLDASKININNIRYKENDTTVSKIEYKSDGEINFKEYPTEAPFPSGYTKLRIDGIRINAYLLPNDVTISREQCQFDRGIICIRGLDNRVTAEGYDVNQLNNVYRIEDRYAPDNMTRDSISICVHMSEEECLLLDIVRPLKREDKIVGEYCIDARTMVPKKLKSQYRRRKFDEDGVWYYDDIQSREQYSSQIQSNRGNYYIEQGIAINESLLNGNLEFVFISTDGREYQLTLVEKILGADRRIKSLCLDNIPQGINGVIIQSLLNRMPKLRYYEPMWIKSDKCNIQDLDRLKLIVKHKLYYSVLLDDKEVTPELLIKFFEDYCTECDNQDKYPNWEFLWSLAAELNKDWTCIHRDHWRKFADDDRKKQLVCDLFINKPGTDSEKLSKFVETYWSIKKRNCMRGGPGRVNRYRSFIMSIFGNGTAVFASMPDDLHQLNTELDKVINK